MSKNYKIGSKFRVTSNSTNGFNVGEIVNLVARRVDGLFEMDNGEFQQALYEDQFELVCEPLPQKLKPAKQALADAIHQNGKGVEGGDWHKSGELPPVGAFVDVVGDSLIYGQGESNCEVIAHVENTAVIRMSYGLGCFESGAIIPARTERDKAIDEMVEVLKSAIQDTKTVHEICASALYNAGYRKEVK